MILLACGVFLLHILSNGQYGFNPDELASVDDARRLAWGYVAYPPMTAFLARASFDLLGITLRSARLFSALAHAFSVLLAGLMARELGGKRLAQVVSALAVVIAPMALASGAVLQYVALDYLWWVLTAYCVLRLLRSENPRWWLGVGAAIGLGMMTKYTMIFLVAGIAVGVLATGARKYLKSPWLWAGAALSVLIFVPNLIWQLRHDFITLDFLTYIHARDLQLGRNHTFLIDQLWSSSNVVTIPLWIAGLFFYFRKAEGRRFRMIGWMAVVPFLLFLFARGRGYYVAPVYPMLMAAGAVILENKLQSMSPTSARVGWAITFVLLIAGGVAAAAVTLPIAPIGTAWWKTEVRLNPDFREEIGWPELAAEVAWVRNSLPPDERARTAIMATSFAEAGAVDLYGPAFGLPPAISGVNNYWMRGYGNPPPKTAIVLGLSVREVNELFFSCRLAGRVSNHLNIVNQETRDRPFVFVCQDPRGGWPELWDKFRYYE